MPTSSFVIEFETEDGWRTEQTGYGQGYSEFRACVERSPRKRWRLTITSLIDGTENVRYF